MLEKLEKELKLCPFCGDLYITHVRSDVGNLHWARCRNCRAEGPVAMDWDEAVELWNMRVI